MKSLALLCLAAFPLLAQPCPTRAPFPTMPIAPTPDTANEGALVTLLARGVFPECAAPPPGQPSTCGPGGYFIQSCDKLQWDYGDGTTETKFGSETTTHAYAHFGLYSVHLHISNTLGSADVDGKVYVASNPGTTIDAPRSIDADEADGSVAVRFTRSGDLSRTNSVNWRLIADANVMTDAQGAIEFAPGETDHAITLPIARDHRFGNLYTSILYVSLVPDGAVAGSPAGDALHLEPLIYVHDADPIPIGSIHDVTVAAGSSVARVPVDLSGSFAFPCCRAAINWRAIDGTAQNGVDYTGPVYVESVVVQPGATRAFIEIPLIASTHTDDRSFDVEIVFASFPLTRSRATVTISGTPPARRRSAR